MWQHLKMRHWPPTSCVVGFCRALPQGTVQDSMWPARRSPAETIKVVVIDTQRVLDQWWGWHIPWQARYYSSATVPQIVFQVLGSSLVTLKAFMSLVRVGPSVCHQLSLPAEQEERGHTVTWTWSLLDERSVKRWKLTAKRCLTKLELLVSCLFFLNVNCAFKLYPSCPWAQFEKLFKCFFINRLWATLLLITHLHIFWCFSAKKTKDCSQVIA